MSQKENCKIKKSLVWMDGYSVQENEKSDQFNSEHFKS